MDETPTAPLTNTEQQTTTSNSANPPAQTPRTFTAEDLERARQEEKDKLYGKISQQDERFQALNSEVEKLRQAREEQVLLEQKHREEAESALKAKAEEEMSAKELLDQRQQEWDAKFTQMQQQQAEKDALFAKEKEFLALQSHIQRRVTEESENIAPELLDYVTGNTIDEVEASIATAKAKTEAIVEAMQRAQANARAQQPGVSPTGYAVTGPMDTNSAQQTYSPEDINNMSMEEFTQLRKKLGIGNSQTSRGLFS